MPSIFEPPSPFNYGVSIPYGDPAGMRALAAVLAPKADAVGALGRQLQGKLESVPFQCSVATEMRRAARTNARDADRLSNDIRALVRLLNAEAGRLEAEIADAHRRRAAAAERARKEALAKRNRS